MVESSCWPTEVDGVSAALRRRQRRLRSWWRHEQQTVAAVLDTFQHHSALGVRRRQDQEKNYRRRSGRVLLSSGSSSACAKSLAVRPRGSRGASAVEQIVDSVPVVPILQMVVQILDVHVRQEEGSFPAVLEQLIVPPLPEAPFVAYVARVRAPLVAVPSLVVPQTVLRDPTDTSLSLTRKRRPRRRRKKELEIFEHSRFRPRRLCRHHVVGAAKKAFAHGEQELHLAALRGADCGRASAADHGSVHQ